MKNCLGCDKPFQPKKLGGPGRKHWQKYCTRTCYMEAIAIVKRTPFEFSPRVCVVCQTTFVPPHPRSISCSKTCAKARHKVQMQTWRAENVEEVKEHHRRYRLANQESLRQSRRRYEEKRRKAS